jgi:hypothetical protein
MILSLKMFDFRAAVRRMETDKAKYPPASRGKQKSSRRELLKSQNHGWQHISFPMREARAFPPAPYRSGSHDMTVTGRGTRRCVTYVFYHRQKKKKIFYNGCSYKNPTRRKIQTPMEKETKKMKWMPILAAAVLLVGIGASIFVNAAKNDSGQILINGQGFSANQLLEIAGETTLDQVSGAPLDGLMIGLGVENMTGRLYTIIGADGYQKTVTWEEMGNGIITKDRVSYFPDLAKAYHVKDIIEIKVE